MATTYTVEIMWRSASGELQQEFMDVKGMSKASALSYGRRIAAERSGRVRSIERAQQQPGANHA